MDTYQLTNERIREIVAAQRRFFANFFKKSLSCTIFANLFA